MGGLVELDGARAILAEQTVDDTDVEMEVSVERRAKATQERDGANLGIRTGSRARVSERGANGPQEDAQHGTGDRGVVHVPKLLQRVRATFSNLRSANTNDVLEDVQTEMAPKLPAHNDHRASSAASQEDD